MKIEITTADYQQNANRKTKKIILEYVETDNQQTVEILAAIINVVGEENVVTKIDEMPVLANKSTTIEKDEFKTEKGVDKTAETMENAPSWIPEGFQYAEGDLDTGYVIEDQYGNQFTYCPPIDKYLSRYEISKGEDNRPMSIPGQKAWVLIENETAGKIAREFYGPEASLIPNADWDELCKFIAKKIGESPVYVNSSKIGAYNGKPVLTGSNPDYSVYNLDSLTGNHWCMTIEGSPYRGYQYIRGGCYEQKGDKWPMSGRYEEYLGAASLRLGFRIVIRK